MSLDAVAIPAASRRNSAQLVQQPPSSGNISRRASSIKRRASCDRRRASEQAEDNNGMRFDYIRVLGQGAFSNVWLAHDVQWQQKVAVKQLRRRNSGDPSTSHLDPLEQQLAEFAIANPLVHPNIVRMYDCLITPLDVLIVQEFVTGGDLFDLVSAYGQHGTPIDVVHSVIRGVVAALEFLRTRGIVHRDLKPENIVIGPENTGKLCDFGLCRRCHL